MFRDIVFEEIYGKLIDEIQMKSYLRGSKDGVNATFAVIDEMVAAGVNVTRDSIIEFSTQRATEQTEELFDELSKIFGKQSNKPEEEPSNNTSVDTTQSPDQSVNSSNVVSLFPQK
jgi:hypothetical protein